MRTPAEAWGLTEDEMDDVVRAAFELRPMIPPTQHERARIAEALKKYVEIKQGHGWAPPGVPPGVRRRP